MKLNSKSYFFRTLITTSNSIAFGCSHTWGVGVEPDEAWPYHLGAKNCGIGGASANLVTRIAKRIIEKEKPETVFVLWPDWSRFEYINNINGFYHQSLPTDTNRIYFMEFHNDDWCKNNFATQVDHLQKICDQNSVNLIGMTLYDLIPYLDHSDTWPLSEDGHHYAPQWHQQVAELFLWAKNTNYKFLLSYE
jgi:hypothetical protein